MEINVSGQNYSTLTQGQSRDTAVQFTQSTSSVETPNSQLNPSGYSPGTEVSLQVGSNSQFLLYRASIEQVNEILANELGQRPLDSSFESGLDVTPEGVAQRIAAMTTGMFSNYLDNHPELSEEAALERFMNLIGEGIDRGFAESREILDSLNLLEGELASNIDNTLELVQQDLEAFSQSFGFDNFELDTAEFSGTEFTARSEEILGDDSFGSL